VHALYHVAELLAMRNRKVRALFRQFFGIIGDVFVGA
jgi:hypothetical protein